MKYLVNRGGLTPTAAAGIVGNMVQESGLDPSSYAIDSNGLPSGGLVSWNGGFFTEMQTWAEQHSMAWNDLTAQLGFLVNTLEGQYSSVKDAVNASSTPQAAALAFSNLYERPAGTVSGATATTPNVNPIANIANRQAQAVAAYNAYKTGTPGRSVGTTSAATPTPIVRPGGPQPTTTVDALLTAETAGDRITPDELQADSFLGGIPVVGTLFTSASDAITDLTDFLKFIAWILSPISWLRMVEFLVGIGLMVFGTHASITSFSQAASTAGSAARSGGRRAVTFGGRVRSAARKVRKVAGDDPFK